MASNPESVAGFLDYRFGVGQISISVGGLVAALVTIVGVWLLARVINRAFQRYAAQMPAAGEIVFFDRSWYNRAGVERVMGFCTPEQSEDFLREAPEFEGMLTRDGIRLIKIFLTIGREMQITRLHARWHDPLKRWKLSPIDFEALPRFDAYSEAFERMLSRTSTARVTWSEARANDKLRTLLNTIRLVLNAIPYKDQHEDVIGTIDDEIVLDAAHYLAKGGES